MSIRLATIINSLGIGGAERQVVNTLNAISCDYKAVICLTPRRTGATFADNLDQSVEVFHVPLSKWTWPVRMFEIARIFKESDVNVVHCHMYRSSLYGSIAASIAGVPVIVTSEHGENPWKRAHHRWIERWIISPLVDMRFCVSPRILEIRRDVDNVPEEKLATLINGVNIPPLKGKTAVGSLPVVGAVGRFIAAKDYPSLLRTASVLKGAGHKFKLCIVGDGPEMSNVKELISKLDLGDIVELPGLVSDMPSKYRLFEVFVISSIREGLPMALLEAMSYGLPVVATDVGAISDVITDGKDGMIINAGDCEGMAGAIATLLKNSELRKKIGGAARCRVQSAYSIDVVATQQIEFYRKLIEKKLR